MSFKLKFLNPVLLVLSLALFLFSSCTYDASFFHRAETSFTCLDEQVFCDGVCIVPSSNAHCGDCGHACTFDRRCAEEMTVDGEATGNYDCACSAGLTDCGDDLPCLSLDGSSADFNGVRCGGCNTICEPSERCERDDVHGVYRCVCRDALGEVLSDGAAALSGQALSEAYLRSDAHCGGCGVNCDVKSGEHCVLGQCTKTVCDDKECHFSLLDGREACQPCGDACENLSALDEKEQKLLLVVTETVKSAVLDEKNTSPAAYDSEAGSFLVQHFLGCSCLGTAEELCDLDMTDRCNADGQCVCGPNGEHCSSEEVCNSRGCYLPCDGLNRTCTRTATCFSGACRCDDYQSQEGGGFAHCIDVLFCGADGRCYCSKESETECGLRGDHCLDDLCVCGKEGKVACTGDAFCRLGQCVCGEGDDAKPCTDEEHCVGGACVCGDDEELCLESERCVAGQCSCGGARACKMDKRCTAEGYCRCAKDGECHDKEVCRAIGDLGKICVCSEHLEQRACGIGAKCESERCRTSDVAACYEGEVLVDKRCVCAEMGHACRPGQVCEDGFCKCSQDGDCAEHEFCDLAFGRCSCGRANACHEGSHCTKEGYCSCSKSDHCNDSEVCKKMGGLGKLCVCGSNDQQKSCKLGVRCQRISGRVGYKCITDDPELCYDGERVHERDGKKHCVCGPEEKSQACRPGQRCDEGLCVAN